MLSRAILPLLPAALVCTAVQASDLPLEQVVLFSSGVGYFHREAQVDGDAEVELSFRTAQINDLLKSLVLQDFDGGQIGPVTYAPREPIERTLSSFAIDISDNPSLHELLNRLRGVRIEVQSGSTHTGPVIGVETQRKTVGDEILEFDVINILTEAGIVEVPIWQVKSLKILDEKVDTDLKKALDVLATSRDVDKRPVSLHFNGQGARKVAAGYLLETPVWKTSYRLVVGDDELHLQGWAIVENTTDDDWDDVDLTLISGQPVSFIQNLYEPLYVIRPTVPVSVAFGAKPQVYEGAMDDYDAEETETAEFRAARRVRAAPGGPTAPGAMGGGALAVAAPAAPAVSASMMFEAVAQTSAAAMASGEKVGELFQYVIDQAVSIGRQKSAMIPIINAATEGEKVSIYNAQTGPKHPRNGVKLTNTTGLHLMGGPITVFDDGMYAGDSLIEDVSPGDDRLLTYAVDLDVEVEQKDKGYPQQLMSIKVARGTLIVTRKQRRDVTYLAKSVSASKRALLIEHPLIQGWELIEPEEPSERTRSVYRFRMDLEPRGKDELKLVLEQPISQIMVLTDTDAHQLTTLVRAEKLSDELKAALLKIVELKDDLSDVQRQIAERESRLEEITGEQDRIRQNMAELDHESDLYKRYVEKFGAQEDEYEKLQTEIKELQTDVITKQQAIQDYIMGLNLE